MAQPQDNIGEKMVKEELIQIKRAALDKIEEIEKKQKKEHWWWKFLRFMEKLGDRGK